jgi:prepilin-type N-terminal cleavage/methylation domain-containing protein
MAARIRAWLREEDGMTMPELLTAMAILAFVMTGVLAMFIGGLHATTNMDEEFQAQQNARLALTSMRNDVRTACQESVPAGGKSVNLTFCAADGTTSQVTWCVSSSTGVAPYGLYRLSGAGICGWSGGVANGAKRATQIVTKTKTGGVVTVFAVPAVGTNSRPQLTVTLPVDANLATSQNVSQGLYTLTDTMTLRNAAVQ